MGVGSEWGPEIGRRMQAAAEAVGLSAVAISEQMGVSASTVHKWWRGEREPSATSLYRYCQLVSRDVAEMYGEEINPRLLLLLGQIADPVMMGRPLGRSAEQALGRSFTDEQRQALDAGSQALREALMEQTGRDWDLLSDDEKRGILAEVVRLARRENRGRHGGSVQADGRPHTAQ